MANTIKENRAKWVAALRSGDYKQGLGRLRHGDEFCCLGVACDVIGDGEWVFRPAERRYYLLDGFSYEGALPLALQEALGIALSGSGVYVTMNDNKKRTFPEIADFIEKLP